MKGMRIPPATRTKLKEIVSSVPSGVSMFVVGGCVRDWLLGVRTKDLDLVVQGDPEPIVRFCTERWKGVPEAFEAFGTHRILFKGGGRVDVAQARREKYPAPAALPIVEPASIDEDLYRRDFTINAMAMEVAPAFGNLLDPWGGLKDLEARRLRVLHGETLEPGIRIEAQSSGKRLCLETTCSRPHGPIRTRV